MASRWQQQLLPDRQLAFHLQWEHVWNRQNCLILVVFSQIFKDVESNAVFRPVWRFLLCFLKHRVALLVSLISNQAVIFFSLLAQQANYVSNRTLMDVKGPVRKNWLWIHTVTTVSLLAQLAMQLVRPPRECWCWSKRFSCPGLAG